MNYELEIENLKKRIEALESIVLKTEAQPQKSEQQQNRDKTKYMFEGKVYAKNRLVLAVVKKYADEHNPNFNQLNQVFDKSLQGSLGVVELLDHAIKVSDAAKRYFLKPEDILTIHGQQVVVCTQWGIFNIVKFIKQAQSLGFNIETI